MSKIEETSRVNSTTISFIDNYQMEIDVDGNHRLVNTERDTYSLWVIASAVSVLDDRMVVSSAYQGLLPINTLILWQRLRNPGG